MEMGIGIAGTIPAGFAVVGCVVVGLMATGGAAIVVATSGFVSLTGEDTGGRDCSTGGGGDVGGGGCWWFMGPLGPGYPRGGGCMPGG